MSLIRSRRRGTVLLLTAFLMIVMMAVLAMALDLGYVYTVRTEMQRSADAGAIAAAWELIDPAAVSLDNGGRVALARNSASDFAGRNRVGAATPLLAVSDVTIGHLNNPSTPGGTIDPSNLSQSNAVQVNVRKTEAQNGKIQLFFAHCLGWDGIANECQATAAFNSSIGGFRQISAGEPNLEILPFALDEDTWNALLAGNASDNYRYDDSYKAVSSGGDGIKEINLYPQGTGSPGNRGTIDIGGANNSTSDISRQIRTGISASDMQTFVNSGRTLKFNSDGKLWLNGDTGISAGVKDDLESIKGKPRIIPIFRQVAGNGNNAEYTIVKFAGVRVMYVKLTGSMSSKQVIIQPCPIVAKGTVPASGETATSYYIYSPPWLVR